jgi:LPS-assembly lipoprotein
MWCSDVTPVSSDASRRTLLRAMSALAVSAMSGCGFELRRPQTLNFRTIQLTGFRSNSFFEKELRRNIAQTPSTTVVDSAAQAEVILQAQSDQRAKKVVASSSAGQVRQFNLRAEFTFAVRTPAGKVMIPTAELALERDMSYTESTALAKESEEDLIFRELQKELVLQVMRRLAALPSP